MKMLLELDETEEPEEPLAKALGVASITLKLILGCPSVIELQNFTPEVEALQNRIAEAIGLVNSEKNVSLEKLEAVCKNLNDMYEMDGTEALGSYLRIYPCSEDAPELSECSFQWYRLTSDVGKKELVSDIDGKREKEEMLLATLTCSSIRFVHYRFLSRSPASIPAASAAPSPLPCVLTSFGIFGSCPTMDSNSSSSSSSFSTFSHSSPSGGRRGRGLEMKDYSRERLRGRGGGGSYNGPGGGKDKIDALGRLLSRILRHMASELNLNMRSDGFVKVEDLLKLNIKTFANIPLMLHTVDDIKEAVKKDNKQRFSLVEENGELWIRANQGHSITTVEAEHLLKPILSAEEVPICVHGTYKKYLPSILEQGLKRMKRLHVHFSCGLPMDGEVISGMRRDVNVLIFLDVARALEEGMKLYISDNKVILTDGFDGVIPVKYFQRIESWPDRRPISF